MPANVARGGSSNGTERFAPADARSDRDGSGRAKKRGRHSGSTGGSGAGAAPWKNAWNNAWNGSGPNPIRRDESVDVGTTPAEQLAEDRERERCRRAAERAYDFSLAGILKGAESSGYEVTDDQVCINVYVLRMLILPSVFLSFFPSFCFVCIRFSTRRTSLMLARVHLVGHFFVLFCFISFTISTASKLVLCFEFLSDCLENAYELLCY